MHHSNAHEFVVNQHVEGEDGKPDFPGVPTEAISCPPHSCTPTLREILLTTPMNIGHLRHHSRGLLSASDHRGNSGQLVPSIWMDVPVAPAGCLKRAALLIRRTTSSHSLMALAAPRSCNVHYSFSCQVLPTNAPAGRSLCGSSAEALICCHVLYLFSAERRAVAGYFRVGGTEAPTAVAGWLELSAEGEGPPRSQPPARVQARP